MSPGCSLCQSPISFGLSTSKSHLKQAQRRERLPSYSRGLDSVLSSPIVVLPIVPLLGGIQYCSGSDATVKYAFITLREFQYSGDIHSAELVKGRENAIRCAAQSYQTVSYDY